MFSATKHQLYPARATLCATLEPSLPVWEKNCALSISLAWRTAAVSKVDEYRTLKTKLDKSLLLTSIYDEIVSRHGRFIKKTPGSRAASPSFCEISTDDAVAKIGHAMRVYLHQRTKTANKCMTHSDGDESSVTSYATSSVAGSSIAGSSVQSSSLDKFEELLCMVHEI